MASDDNSALVAELKRYREREPDARSFVVAREEYDRLLALADEALRLRKEVEEAFTDGEASGRASLREELEILRRVRDAAAEYARVAWSDGLMAKMRVRRMANWIRAQEKLRAALDADAARGKR